MKRFWLHVVAPRSIAAGKRATLRVRLSRSALARLRGRTLKVRFAVTSERQGATTNHAVTATIRATPRARNG